MAKLSSQKGLIRIGLLSKGLIYFLIGIVALVSILGTGGQISGKKGIVNWIMTVSYGPYVVLFLAIGSFIYAIWTLLVAFKQNPHKSAAIGHILRAGDVLSGLFYLFFAFYVGDLAFGHFYPALGSISSGDEQSSIFMDLMRTETGRSVVLLMAILIASRGLHAAIVALSGQHKKKVNASGFKPKYRGYILRVGYVGYLGQAVSAFIVAYLLYQAVETNDLTRTGKEEDVFRFVKGVAGTAAVAAVAFGMFCYGFFYDSPGPIW